MSDTVTERHCPGCGVAGEPHAACVARLDLEPPRFCRACGRRMVVQVTPVAWTARCSRHGETSAAG